MAVKLIVSDLDNTLLNKESEISDYTSSIINKIISKGILFCYATARSHSAVVDFTVRVSPDYMIINNGARIYFGGRRIAEHPIERDTLNRLLQRLTDAPFVDAITVDAGDHALTNVLPLPWTGNWNPVLTDFKEPLGIEVTKLSFSAVDAGAAQLIIDDFPELRAFSNSHESWVQMVRADVSMANGLKAVCEHAGISLADTLAFGDDVNDIEMLQAAGRGIAVANAAEIVKRAADGVCGKSCEDGVARWLAEYFL